MNLIEKLKLRTRILLIPALCLAMLLALGGLFTNLIGEQRLVELSPLLTLNQPVQRSGGDGEDQTGADRRAEQKSGPQRAHQSSTPRRYPCPRRVWISLVIPGRSSFLRR